VTARGRAALGWLVVVGAALTCVATRLSVNADFAAFLPSATTGQQRFLVSELKEGVASRLLLIELSGDTAERLADVSRTLAGKLGADGRFRYVNNGDADFGRGDFDALRAHRYQLSDAVAPERFTADGLRTALAARVRSLSGGTGLFEKTLLPEDPTGETLHLVDRLTPATQPRRVQGAWFDPSGARALLLAETRAPGSDLDGQAEAIAALERAFAAAKGDRDVQLRYSSPGAMAAQSRTLIAADASRLALVSTALIVALLGFVYRSPVIVLLCALPALTGLLVGVVAIDVAFGGVHAITLGFGATLLGEAVDYPGYLLTQMRGDEPAPAAVARLAATLAMAVLTTAAAAVALLLVDFPGLAQLGLLTMVGVLGAGIVTAWVLPYWVPRSWHPVPARASVWAWRWTPSPGARLALAAVLVAGLLALASGKPWWDDDLANMNPLATELKQRDRELRAALGAPEVRYMLLIEGATRDDAIASAERLRPALERAVMSQALDGFELVSDYLPSQATQQRRQAVLPDDAQLRASFAEAASGLPVRVTAFEPFFAAVERARVAPPVDASNLAGTALGLKLDGLLRPDGGRWHVVVPLVSVASAGDARKAIEQSGVAGAQWVDLQATSRDMMGAFRANALRAFGLGALLILGVLAAGLHSARAAARVALPVTAAVVATAAAIVALGQPLTVFHLVALMLVAGIGTNYALFLARGAAAGDPPAMTARSLAVVGGTTLCAFGTLATSEMPVLRTIGLTVALGVVLCLTLSALLPAASRQPPRPA
jgi:predicted exporter